MEAFENSRVLTNATEAEISLGNNTDDNKNDEPP